MSEINYIAYASDNNYAVQTGVSLISLFDNNPGINFCVYLFSDNISEINCQKLIDIADKYSQQIIIKDMPNLDYLTGVNLFVYHWAKATYCRLFFTELLPEYINKILWLDSDTLIIDKITQLFDVNVSNYAGAAALDTSNIPAQLHGFKQCEKYYNAGVLVINLEYWRKNEINKQFLCEIKKRKGKSIDVDQSYINCILKNKIITLPPEYNLMKPFYDASKDYQLFLKNGEFKEYQTYSIDELEYAVNNVKIIHFAGRRERPWFKNIDVYGKDMWLKYKEMSPFKNFELLEYVPPRLNSIKKFIKAKFSFTVSIKRFVLYDFILKFNHMRRLYVRLKYGFWL